MRAAFLTHILSAGFSASAFASSQTGVNHYDVFRNGKQIGTHIVTFKENGSKLTVETQSKMKVKLLFVTAFSYDYKSIETWEGGQLISVDSVTENRSGGIKTLATRDGDIFRVQKTTKDKIEDSLIDAPLMPTSHWNMAGLHHDHSFDPISSINFPVTISKGENPNQEYFTGQRYDVSGEYEYATYYDRAGHWQGMAFERKGFIEFRCVECKNTLWPKAGMTDTQDPKLQLSSYP